MKRALFLVFFLSYSVIFSQIGKEFPSSRGTSLADKSVTLPLKNGKYSVIAIAFHRNAEEDLKKWLNPLFDAFIRTEDTKGTFDMAEIHDVNFYFIPLIAGFKKIAEDFKSKTDKQFWDYIIDTEKTDIKLLQKQLDVADNKIPHFYVLDPQGRIVAMQSGKFSPARLEKLEDAIE